VFIISVGWGGQKSVSYTYENVDNYDQLTSRKLCRIVACGKRSVQIDLFTFVVLLEEFDHFTCSRGGYRRR
jgi:hypothetical protein